MIFQIFSSIRRDFADFSSSPSYTSRLTDENLSEVFITYIVTSR